MCVHYVCIILPESSLAHLAMTLRDCSCALMHYVRVRGAHDCTLMKTRTSLLFWLLLTSFAILASLEFTDTNRAF